MAKFTINVEMNDRWVNHFCSFLEEMQSNGSIGHSSLLGFYADGDGDFNPTFDFSIDYEKVPPICEFTKAEVEQIYDAG